MDIAAPMWNWTSAASSRARGRPRPPLSARFDVNGPPPPIQWPRFSSVSASFSGQSSSLRVDDAVGRVVGQVQAELGRLGDDLHLQRPELLRPAEPAPTVRSRTCGDS